MKPSSVHPLQLLSVLSQTSGEGGAGVHAGTTPLTQPGAVRVQAPMPQVWSAMPSSTVPLQLLSRPSQVSVVPHGMQAPTRLQ